MKRIIGLCILSLALAACATADDAAYPRLGDAPEAPTTTLSPERTAEIKAELETARDEAVAFAAQGRRSGSGPAVPPEPEPLPDEGTEDQSEPVTE